VAENLCRGGRKPVSRWPKTCVEVAENLFRGGRKPVSRWTKTCVEVAENLCRGGRTVRTVIYSSILLRMRNSLEKKLYWNPKHTFSVQKFFPRKTWTLWEDWCSQTGHRWQYNTAHALCMLDNEGYIHTPRIFNNYWCSMATMLTRTRLEVYVIGTLRGLFFKEKFKMKRERKKNILTFMMKSLCEVV
jgi:hypothetical protein